MYPLLLSSTLKDYLWGGNRLKTEYGFKSDFEKIAEAWVLSCHEGDESTVLNGELKGKTLNEAISIFGKDCLGKNCEKFEYFPLLIKLIDAKQKLSIQVHPDDDYSTKNEGEYGKTEMWYIVDCEDNAKLIYGLDREVSKEELEKYINEDRITEICKYVPVKKGDVFFIPAGTVHAIGEGILIAEVQQNSNITYRVSDYGRLGADGKPRELHKQKALDVINLSPTPQNTENSNASHKISGGVLHDLAKCKYFTAQCLELDGNTELCNEDSFMSVLILEGNGKLRYQNSVIEFSKGYSFFVPANIKYTLNGNAKILLSQV